MSSDAPALWGFFAAGLAGGAGHCVAMCGPVAASLGLAAPPGAGALAAAARALPYHLGRVTTYALLGAVMGLTGSFVNVAGRLAGLSNAVAVLAGGLMILLGLGTSGISAPLGRLTALASSRLVALARGILGGGSAQLYPLGLLLGFLPCGLSWTAFLGAAATGGPVPGFVAAASFGLGTVPGLLAAGALAAAVGGSARGLLRRLGGILVAGMGLLFVLRGLGVHVGA